MAGTAPTRFRFTTTPDAGTVHCSVRFFGSRPPCSLVALLAPHLTFGINHQLDKVALH